MDTPERRLAISTDWTIAGPFLIGGFHHAAFEARRTVLRCEPERARCYTQLGSLSRLPDEPRSYPTSCFALAAEATSTALTLTIDKHPNFSWGTTLEVLKRFVERQVAAGATEPGQAGHTPAERGARPPRPGSRRAARDSRSRRVGAESLTPRPPRCYHSPCLRGFAPGHYDLGDDRE